MNQNYAYSDAKQQIKEVFRHLWNRLTDEEVDAYEERRDEFFIAIRKKHGVVRAQAEIMLREILSALEPPFREAA